MYAIYIIMILEATDYSALGTQNARAVIRLAAGRRTDDVATHSCTVCMRPHFSVTLQRSRGPRRGGAAAEAVSAAVAAVQVHLYCPATLTPPTLTDFDCTVGSLWIYASVSCFRIHFSEIYCSRLNCVHGLFSLCMWVSRFPSKL